MFDKSYNVLFICTGNSARSIIAESLMNHLGEGRFKAYSAGSHPKGEVNPHALSVLSHLNMPVTGLSSKSWDVFAAADSPKLDFVFTVCDKAAGEMCPVWPGQPMSAHWGVEDPAEATGSPDQIGRKFKETVVVLKRRIELLLALPMASIDKLSLQNEIQRIGKQ